LQFANQSAFDIKINAILFFIFLFFVITVITYTSKFFIFG